MKSTLAILCAWATVSQAQMRLELPAPRSTSTTQRLTFDESGEATNGRCANGKETPLNLRTNTMRVLWKDYQGKPQPLQLQWLYTPHENSEFTLDLLSFKKTANEDPTHAPTAAPGGGTTPEPIEPKDARVESTVVMTQAGGEVQGQTGPQTDMKNITDFPTCRPARAGYNKTCALRMRYTIEPTDGTKSTYVSCADVYIFSSNDDIMINAVVSLGETSDPLLPSSFKSRLLDGDRYSSLGLTENNLWVVPPERADYWEPKEGETFSASGGQYRVKIVVGDHYGRIGGRTFAAASEDLALAMTTDAAGFAEQMGLKQENGPRLVSLTYGGKAGAIAGTASTLASLLLSSTLAGMAWLLH
jgi:hypothetical protein